MTGGMSHNRAIGSRNVAHRIILGGEARPDEKLMRISLYGGIKLPRCSYLLSARLARAKEIFRLGQHRIASKVTALVAIIYSSTCTACRLTAMYKRACSRDENRRVKRERKRRRA